jgi:prepilin-type N-terminal cleavage/methylation domain-containing protein
MCASSLARPAVLRRGGFTLIEVLIVLVICAGLVALMTGLYRSVGLSALALRSAGHEWSVQQQLRHQLLHLFSTPAIAGRQVEGGASELSLLTWQSRASGSTGKPVLAKYRYDASNRVLYYQEQTLSAWWPNAAFDISQVRYQALQATEGKLLSAVEELSFRFLPPDATDIRTAQWRPSWDEEGVPRLVELRFTRAGRGYTLLFETRSADG